MAAAFLHHLCLPPPQGPRSCSFSVLLINHLSLPPNTMSHEKHHHHFLDHHHKKEKPAAEMTKKDYEKEVKHHKHLEHVGKVGVVAAGSYALHEKHMAKKDPEHAHSHKIKEEIAVTVAVGSLAFSRHEHHEKKEAKKEQHSAFEKKHHHF
ncbi:hypothetical protein NE237_016374 [Protea cynaroides]|uniref:Uncharacterized protein n=1 Tax=Protea cynaroides TaxID=273540 RepID=A0A9Q0HH00_9MAGN|nr:hypothetical protein NE237_016374 [Protea cynaroides]